MSRNTSHNFSTVDVRQLRHFLSVAETLHFGRAAQRLSMTQPPLSQSILALERELGAPLFVRTRRSVALSAFGEQWLPHARAVLQGHDALAATARRLLAGELGRLQISFVSTADYSVLPELVLRFRESHPDVELSLTEATSDVQIAALLEGRGQVGIILPDGQESMPGMLRYHRLESEPLVAAVPEAWVEQRRIRPLRGRLARSEVVASPLVLFPRHVAPLFYDKVVGYCSASGGQVAIAQHAIQMQTIVSLVSAGMGIALVPASLRRLARAGVRYLELQDAPSLEMGMVWRADRMDPVLDSFLRMAGVPAGAEARGPLPRRAGA